MKIISMLPAALILFSGCNQKKIIEFKSLKHTEFNTKPLEVLTDAVLFDSVKNSYDSCKSFTFPANAIIISKRDSLFIGDIVNRQTLHTVNTLQATGLTETQLLRQTQILSTACYEKHSLHIPVKTLLGEHFVLQLPNAGEAMNKELNDAVMYAAGKEIQTGSWMYLDLKDALPYMLDTMQSATALAYKKDLLNADNMILTTVESVTDVGINITTQSSMSDSLQKLLQQKPFAASPNPKFQIQLFYIDDRKFQVHFTGLFPVAGRFMKAEE